MDKNNLEYYRKKKKMTQGELAKKIGVSTTFVSQIENGISNPSDENLLKISEILDVSVNDLNLSNRNTLSSNTDIIIELIRLLKMKTKSNLIKWVEDDEISEFNVYKTIINDTEYILVVNTDEIIISSDLDKVYEQSLLLEINTDDKNTIRITDENNQEYQRELSLLHYEIIKPEFDYYTVKRLIQELNDL
ncbi:helix-turn-helix domain-containing protein [Anaerococcus degeneri]|uniref:Helix-turn-helix domain-containing protein n=1 Tax=Anaerococcus degeneri TaxID=361500 RepID=A0ABS7YWY1_9FIRM|nr:helix-turn-helix transcriptional regulator [Anaerococcus degeneri]MBP2015352.1 transcriptional regulator with XRE-family HTH domain [Anaerococcus degeneri]MCA2096248.1 helix-turn-helix domain-containing protein [Anaerococcus degeneri]